MASLLRLVVLAGLPLSARAATCPGSFAVEGLGSVALVPTGWNKGGAAVEVRNGRSIVPHMGGRAYFAETCVAGKYNHEQYLGMNLLGKTFRYTTDMSGSGCGCNAALYLVSMRQNSNPSTCQDYYCDANSVCGVACAEIDIQEANQHAWHSTLHSATDHNGVGSGFGGGDGWTGPRDFTAQQYGPGAQCIDTTKSFEVSVSFPVNGQGQLIGMEVTLSQEGHSCPLVMKLHSYSRMAQLSAALAAGMTPVLSYWSDDGMLWMDGEGADGQGPCQTDNAAACPDTVQFYDFSVSDIGEGTKPADKTPSPVASSSHNSLAHKKASAAAHAALCPGDFKVQGYGHVSLTSAMWNVPGEPAGRVEVSGDSAVVPHMKGRAYFADACTPGTFDNKQYVGFNLLGKVMRYTTDMSGAGCGCNAALYMVSMKQNSKPSDCQDHYCDANNVCGESCAEIDIQEANQHAWHSTLHTASDHGGLGAGFGGGSSWNGPRDFGAKQYGPLAECVDTTRPFDVSVAFPVNGEGVLKAMEVTLEQAGKSCPLVMRIGNYAGMAELSRALAAGMTPVISYWSADDMTWMDGRGADGRGPCAVDDASACAGSVRFYNFSISSAAGAGGAARKEKTEAKKTPEAACPGTFRLGGHGDVALVPTGWGASGASPVEVRRHSELVPHMGGRAYFAETCTAGRYDHEQFLALNLLGKTLRYSTNMSGSGCGCNAALYLVSMRQNSKPSTCNDYYCDANSVCGVACAEIDIQEGNQYAWHSTLHTSADHAGKGVGFGGGDSWNGPRDFSAAQYSPGGRCIDTSKAFDVAVSFPVDASGTLRAMEVTLSQAGSSCPLEIRVGDYNGMAELSEALAAGMTPVVSYWSADDMLWMDGVGADGGGPCARDDAAACPETVRFFDFSVSDIQEVPPPPGPAAPRPPLSSPASPRCVAAGEDCLSAPCCAGVGACEKRSAWWARCRVEAFVTDQTTAVVGYGEARVKALKRTGSDVVELTVEVNRSDLPLAWVQGADLLVGADRHRVRPAALAVHATVLSVDGVPTSAGLPPPAAGWTGPALAGLALLALAALAVACSVLRHRRGAPSLGSLSSLAALPLSSPGAVEASKSRPDAERPTALRFGESPVRRRNPSNGAQASPQPAGHSRWPSEALSDTALRTPGGGAAGGGAAKAAGGKRGWGRAWRAE